MCEPAAWTAPWPYWKFGLKQDDLTTTLHKRFNTIPSAIQDPEAFHHDVYELSNRASTLAEFEHLMAERKELRLKELQGTLEDASFEIVGNPSLIGTEQWQLAVQLFRTRSFDSLVRYFSSYLPVDHPWNHDSDSAINSVSDPPSPVDCGPIMFDDPEEDEFSLANQSSDYSVLNNVFVDKPVRSMTTRSEDSGVSVSGRDQCKLTLETLIPAAFVSAPQSVADHDTASLQESTSILHEDAVTSPSDSVETPSTPISDLSELDHACVGRGPGVTVVDNEMHDGSLLMSHAQPLLADDTASGVPEPKFQNGRSSVAPFADTKPLPLSSGTMLSSRTHPHHAHPAHQDYTKHLAKTRQQVQNNGKLNRYRSKRSLGEKSSGIRKTVDGRARHSFRCRSHDDFELRYGSSQRHSGGRS